MCGYVKLYLGVYDIGRGHIRGNYRQDGRYYECSAGFRRRCSVFMHYDDWRDGTVGWAYGDRTKVRLDCQADQRDTAFYQFSFSADSQGTSCARVYFYESDCQCAGAWLGVYAGGA